MMNLEKNKQRIQDVRLIFKLKRVQINLGNDENAKNSYKWLNSRHQRLPLIRRKALGVELIELSLFKDFEEYLNSINGKNSAAYYRRKALGRDYVFEEIDRNKYVDDIYTINTSLDARQGRSMGDSYLKKQETYVDEPGWRYFGVCNSAGHLVAYVDVNICGEVAMVNRLLGHGKYLNDGIMYLLLIDVAGVMFAERATKYFMYDMYFGASKGLRLFKEKLGFSPFWVRWVCQ